MAILAGLLMLVSVLCGIGSLVCFILVLIKMFQNNETTMGIVCIVTIFCGLGGLIAFVVGWINAGKWQIQQIMIAWTGCFIGGTVLYLIGLAMLTASGVGEFNADFHVQQM